MKGNDIFSPKRMLSLFKHDPNGLNSRYVNKLENIEKRHNTAMEHIMNRRIEGRKYTSPEHLSDYDNTTRQIIDQDFRAHTNNVDTIIHNRNEILNSIRESCTWTTEAWSELINNINQQDIEHKTRIMMEKSDNISLYQSIINNSGTHNLFQARTVVEFNDYWGLIDLFENSVFYIIACIFLYFVYKNINKPNYMFAISILSIIFYIPHLLFV